MSTPPPLPPPVPTTAASRAIAAAPDDGPGARAIEIAALLGDTVVSVKHCIDPRGGPIAPATWAVLAVAAAGLIASALAFGAALRSAADDRARLDVWTRVAHRPAYAFRPHRLGAGSDAIGFGGLAVALVGAGLGLARARRERVRPCYRIGDAPGVDLALAGAPSPAFALVAPSGDDFVFRFVPGAPGSDGELLLDGTVTPLAALGDRAPPSPAHPGEIEVAIPRGARIRARVGAATLIVSSVPRPRRHVAPLLAGLERRAVAYVAGSLIVHLAVVLLLAVIPPAGASVAIELPSVEPIAVNLVGTEADDGVPAPTTDDGASPGAGGGPDMALPSPSGAAGDPDATDHGRRQIARGDAPLQSRAAAIAEARQAGLLGDDQLLAGIEVVADLGELAGGFDRRSATGPLVGDDVGNGPGAFGGGFVDLGGLGAGCDAVSCGGCIGPDCGGVLRTGAYATIHDGPGGGGRFGLPGHGRGPGDPGRTPALPRIGTPDVVGAGYDKAIIRRYLRRHLDEIGYCYAKQLLARPGLGGELTVTFFIAPTGRVERAAGTGFDPAIASCVAAVIQTIAFPRPGDGTGVEVHYPFQFHAAGS